MNAEPASLSVDRIIDALAADARPVTPLRSPARRALVMLGLFALAGAMAMLRRRTLSPA